MMPTASTPRISVIVAAFNEEDRIATTIRGINAIPNIHEVIVVDDGSADRTSEAATGAGAKVQRQAANSGKGAAMAAGAELAEGDILMFLDADLGDTAIEAAVLLNPIIEGEADLTIATFPIIPGKGGGFGIVVKLARWGIHKATGRIMAAPISGQRAITKDGLQRIGGLAPGFSVETAMTIDALRTGLRVVEVPTTMTHRVTGKDWKARFHRLKQLMAVVRALWSRRKYLLHPLATGQGEP
jgi:glycosyltransferase involved in cell wall biosynthesis